MAATMVFPNLAGKLRFHRQFRRLVLLNRRFFNAGCICSGISSENSKQRQRAFHCGIVSSFDKGNFSAPNRRTVTDSDAIPCYVQNIRYRPNVRLSVPDITSENSSGATSVDHSVIPYFLNVFASIADISRDQASKFVFVEEKVCCDQTYDQFYAPQATANNHAHRRQSRHNFKFIGVFGALFFKKEKEEESVESLVGKAVASEKRGHMDKAEDFYHLAVKLAQEENRPDKVVYIFDMMGNFYLKINKFLKAEQLFKETIKLLLESGFLEHDPAVLEISLKLAGIYDLQFRYTEAEAGFQFCVSKAEEGVKIFKEKGEEDRDREMNLYAMLGVSLDAYGKFMLKRKKFAIAEEAYIRAIKICENQLAENGKPHPQIATLLNDLGTVFEEKKDYKKAMEVISRAEVLAKDSPENLAVILCNKASLHLRNDEREQATTLFRQALRLAERSQDEETVRFVRIAMSKLAAPLKK